MRGTSRDRWVKDIGMCDMSGYGRAINPTASFDFVVVAFVVVGNRHSGTDGYVVIPRGALVCLRDWRSGRGGIILGSIG